MKSSPTKKNRRVRHVWWWPWLLLKASFDCPLQSPFFSLHKTGDLFILPYFKQNIKGISHNVCNHSQCPFISHQAHTHTCTRRADEHALAPRGLPDQHTSTHTQPPPLQAVNPDTQTHIPRRFAHIYTDKLRIKAIDTHHHTPLLRNSIYCMTKTLLQLELVLNQVNTLLMSWVVMW